MKQHTRRIPQQWQVLIEPWQDSGLSEARLCDVHALGDTSFCHWRKWLMDASLLTAAHRIVEQGNLKSA